MYVKWWKHRILIGACQMVEDMDTDWCMSNGGGHRMLIGACQMVEAIDRMLIGVWQMVEDIGY